MINLHAETPLPATRLPELVAAVLNAENYDEADWLEWKSTLDLTARAGLIHLSRAILGFANRDPQKIQQSFGGTAYILVGVAPRDLQGIKPVDLEMLQPKLEKYLGTPGPRWIPHYVHLEKNPDLHVLVIEVPAPRLGEYPYPWRTTYQPAGRSEKGSDSGTLYVRRGSKTERANYEEVLMLAKRAAQGTAPRHLNELAIEVEMMLSLSGPLRTAHIPDSVSEGWLERRRQILLAPTAEDAVKKLGLTRKLSDPQIREYSRKVDAYLDECRSLVKGVLLTEMMLNGMNGITIDVNNPSDDHLSDVEVKITMPDWCTVIVPKLSQRHVLPEPPPPPLPSTFASIQIATPVQSWVLSRDTTEPPRFTASPNLVNEGRKVYREGLGTIRPRSHRHTCTLQLLVEDDIDHLDLRVEITSPSFPGVIDRNARAPVLTLDATLVDQLLDPDPTKAAEDRRPRFPPSHQH